MAVSLTIRHSSRLGQAETTLINFMVTEDGLEDQLLALTVSKERPDLEEQKAEIIQSTNDNKIKIKSLEDGILEQLANAEGDVLENIELIENLEDSKRVSTEIAEKMAVAVETEKKINISRENYRKVAGRGSLMFFLLSDLNKMHTFQCGADLDLTTSGSAHCLALPCLLSRSPRGRWIISAATIL